MPYLEIEDYNRDGSTIPITVKDEKKWKKKSGIRAPEDLFKAFVSLVDKSPSEGFDRQAAYQDCLVARANDELAYDVLITLSPYLLGNRENPWLRFVNLRSPLEAVKIVGLLLRTRGGYLFEAKPNYFLEMDRRSIYEELLRHKLPSISRYSYAVNLVDECFRQIDKIASLTDVTRLLPPPNFDVTQLRDNAPSNEDEFVRQRIELLD